MRALGSSALAGIAALSALVGAIGDGRRVGHFAALAVVLGGVGVLGLTTTRMPRLARAPQVFVTTTLVWGFAIAVSTAVYLLTGATSRFGDALFESVAGFTTTAMTTVVPESLPDAVLFWRAATQWLGGVAGLVLAVVLVPWFARDDSGRDRGPRSRSGGELAPVVAQGFRRVFVVYVAATMIGIALLALAGLNGVDATTHAMTTVSTGGFSTYSAGVASFDDPVVEWIITFGMLTGGVNLALLWLLFRGEVATVVRAGDVRTYGAVVATASLAVYLWTITDGASAATVLRHAVFTVASVVSTTGHSLPSWEAYPDGAVTFLVILVGIGGMAGSASGGFRQHRVLATVGIGRRELARELHPQVVRVVRTGGRPVSESELQRVAGFAVLFVLLAATGGFLIASAAPGLGVTGAMSASVSALATAGPMVTDEPGTTSVIGFGDTSRTWLMVLMVFGRLAIFPVLVGILTVLERGARLVERIR